MYYCLTPYIGPAKYDAAAARALAPPKFNEASDIVQPASSKKDKKEKKRKSEASVSGEAEDEEEQGVSAKKKKTKEAVDGTNHHLSNHSE